MGYLYGTIRGVAIFSKKQALKFNVESLRKHGHVTGAI